MRAAHARGAGGGGVDEGGLGYRSPEGTELYAAYVRDPVGDRFCVYAAS